MFDLAGNIHVHTRYSDGTGDVEAIAEAAGRAGLDFVIITDHNHLKAKKEEGYYGSVLVLVGSELNEQANHYLALNIEEEIEGDDENPQKVIDKVAQLGGLGFIAHPMEKGSLYYENGRTYPWTAWEVKGITGMDIWSYLSQWRDGLTNMPRALYNTYLNPHGPLRHPYPETLKKWSEMQMESLVVGIGCSDAHAIKIRKGCLFATISDYFFSFRCINTHLVTTKPLRGDLNEDKKVVYQSLREGRCYVSYDYFWNPKGFKFFARGRDGWVVNMGQRVPHNQVSLEVSLPASALVQLIRNGSVYRRSQGKVHVFSSLPPGVYRVEVKRRRMGKLRTWIISNHIFLE